jgi:phospholipase/carboxylesterase
VQEAAALSTTWSWWPSRPATGDFEELSDGLLASRRHLTEALEGIRRTWGTPPEHVFVGGFSQGATAAIDAALHLPWTPGLLAVFAGHGIEGAGWEERLRGHPVRVLQTHGTRDAGTPLFRGSALRGLLERGGAAVEFLEFEGPHTIPQHGLDRLAQILVERMAERA